MATTWGNTHELARQREKSHEATKGKVDHGEVFRAKAAEQQASGLEKLFPGNLQIQGDFDAMMNLIAPYEDHIDNVSPADALRITHCVEAYRACVTRSDTDGMKKQREILTGIWDDVLDTKLAA